MGRSQRWIRSISISLIISLVVSMVPSVVLAEAVDELGSSLKALVAEVQEQETWEDGPDKTEAPDYYSFDGEKVLEERPNMGKDRDGARGSNLEMKDSDLYFSVQEKQLTFTWEDTLKEWISEQRGTPVNPPSGYDVTVELEDIHSKETYTLVSNQTDHSGENSYVWDGKDDKGKELPDGFYYWKLSAHADEITFMVPVEDGLPMPVPKIPPSYPGEKQMVILDRTAPEVVGIHPLDEGKVAIEARDHVAGLQELTVQGAASFTKSWDPMGEPPLRVAAAVQPGAGETLTISVKDAAGNHTEDTLPVYPFITGTGSEDHMPHAESVIAGEEVRINLVTGNGLQKFEGFVQERPGADLGFFLTYNHQNRIRGTLGYGWSLSLDSRLTKWPGGDITWVGFDGTLYWFKPIAGDSENYVTYANGQEQHYPNLTFSPNSSSDDRNAFVMEWPNQLRYRFHNDGRFWMIQDRYTTELKFDWEEVPTYHGYDYRIKIIKDMMQGEIVTFYYQNENGNLNSTVIQEVDALGNPVNDTNSKRKFFFIYNSEGEFVGYKDPSPKITLFAYDSLHRIKEVMDNTEKDSLKPESVITKWTYREQNRLERISMTRKQDLKEEFLAVEPNGSEAAVSDPLGKYTLRWDEAFHPKERIEDVQTLDGERKAKTEYVYSANNLIRVTDPLERVTRYKYNDADQIIAEQSPSGRIVHYEYDSSQDLIRETGPDGYQIQIDYVKDGRKILTKTTTQQAKDPAGVNDDEPIVAVEEFNARGDLVKRIDGNGKEFVYTYDENGFLTSDDTRVAYENDRNGNPLNIIIDGKTEDKAVIVQTFTSAGWLEHRESPSGLNEDFEYDLWGRVKKVQQQDRNDTTEVLNYTYSYDDGGNLIEESNGLTKTTYTVDGKGNVLTRKTVPLMSGTEGEIAETYTYDNRGLVTSETDSRGETTKTTYNLAGEPVRVAVLPGNAITTIEYDEAGRQKNVIAPDNGRTAYEYDAWDRVKRVESTIKATVSNGLPLNIGNIPDQTAITEYRYDSAGQLVEEKQPDGAWTRYAYDGNGNTTEETMGGPIPEWNGASLPSGRADTLYPGHEVLGSRAYTYDKLGRVLTETDGNGHTTAYKYTGRSVETLIPALGPDGNPAVVSRTEVYDPAGNVVHTVSELNHSTTTTFDAFGHATEFVNEEGQRTTYKTDIYGRTTERVETIDNSGATQQMFYQVDAWGNVLEEKRQLNASEWAATASRYSPEGDLLETTDAAGLHTLYVYDEHGQLKELQETDAVTGKTRLTSFTYDNVGRRTSVLQPDGSHEFSVYDTSGREVVAIDGLNHATGYMYNPAGQLLKELQYKEGTTRLDPTAVSAQTRYLWDGAGNAVITQDPNDNVIRNAYDAEGNLLTETHYEYPNLSGKQIVNRYAYDPRGLLVVSTDGNGHTTAFQYDAEGQPTRVIDAEGHWMAYEYSPAGFATAERRPLGRDTEWQYDYRGNKLLETDALGHSQQFELDLDGRATVEYNKLHEPTNYVYDLEGRMTSKAVSGLGTYAYQYDAVGNKLSETKPVYGTTQYDYDLRDNLTEVHEPEMETAYTYDADQNRLSQQDGREQLTTYDYDEAGRRLTKTVVREVNTDLFTYTYDPNGNLLSETKPGGVTTRYAYDFMNQKVREDFSDGTWTYYTYDNAGNVLTRSDQTGTITYTYYKNDQMKSASYPNGDTIVYEYNENGEKSAEIVNGKRTAIVNDTTGRPTTYIDENGHTYTYEYDADGYVKAVIYPNGTVTNVDYMPGHLIGTQQTEGNGAHLYASAYDYNARGFITGVKDQDDVSAYDYNDTEQLDRIVTPEGDVMQYEYDRAGNRTVRKTTIQGAVEDKQTVITSDELVQMVLASFGMKMNPKPADAPGNSDHSNAPAPCVQKNNGNNNGNGNGNGNGKSQDNNGKGKGKNASAHPVQIASATMGKLAKNDKGNGSSGNNDKGNSGKSDNDHGNGNGNGNNNGKGNGNNGNGNGIGQGNGNSGTIGNCGNGNGNGNGKGWLNALENGNGKKLGLYKKLGQNFDSGEATSIDTIFETGQIEHLLAAIDNIVNGEVNLPPGEHTKLFERIRQVGKGYTVIGTKYTYNDRNQLAHRENLIRYEEYDYAYDEAGNLLTDGRSRYEWNARGHLTKVTFPDGFGEKYAYDMQGRRISKIQFNHQGETQQTTNYHYKGDTWMLTEEVVVGDGEESSKSYTYDTNGQPLSITFKGETFWYVYNGHGDVMALTDQDGNVAARYEYDAWGLVTRMYNRYGERVREGIGWMGDLGSGNGSPGSLQGPEDDTGNTVPDYHPGIGNSDEHVNGNGNGNKGNNGNGKSKGKVEIQSLLADAVTDTEATTDTSADSTDATLLESMVAEESEPTEDITTDLVKENPIRYAGYHWDRKTQTYYLQARYYDPRPARFISEDTYEGEIESPLSLNLYTYVSNNPLKYADPSGHRQCEGAVICDEDPTQDITKLTLAKVLKEYPERWKFDRTAKGFYLAQQYYLVWYYGTKAYDRLDEATLSHNSYLVIKLNSLRKKGRDLSKLTVAEVDKMSFNISSTWFKVDTAALGIYGVSNPYGYAKGAGYFKVDPAMQAADKAAGVLKNGSYIKNPTAKNLNDLITDSGKIGSKQMSGQYMYVVDTNGNVIIGTRAGQKMPHPTLIGGENPQVKAAGIVEIRGGQIYKVDNSSGHYKPSAESLQAAEEAFGKLPSSAFSSSFQGYVPYNK